MRETNLVRAPTGDQIDGSKADGTSPTSALEVERLRRALDEQQERNLRLLADLDNFRRRATREREAAHFSGRRAALLPVLAALDTLERALAAGSTDPDFYEGVSATLRLFIDALLEAGAEPFDSVGEKFDPASHEAVDTVHVENVEPGTVAQQLRRGWRLGDELLRAAQVIVAAAPIKPTGADPYETHGSGRSPDRGSP
jgi:molecular chaperone GrpE